MWTTPTLLDVITEEGSAEAQRVLAAATAEAARLRADAATEAGAIVRNRVEARRRELAADFGRRRAAARQASRRRVFEARDRLLAKVRESATAMLPAALLGPGGRPQVAALLDEAWQYLPPGGAVVRCQPGLGSVVQSCVAGRPNVEVMEDPSVHAGLRIASQDGRLTVDNTLETRLARSWEALAAELLAKLGSERPRS